MCDIFYFPWHSHQIEETNGVNILSKRDRQSGVRKLPKCVSETSGTHTQDILIVSHMVQPYLFLPLLQSSHFILSFHLLKSLTDLKVYVVPTESHKPRYHANHTVNGTLQTNVQGYMRNTGFVWGHSSVT